MDTHRIFAGRILPNLLDVAKNLDILDFISSISLYGSANYELYSSEMSTTESVGWKSDYDLWIVFRKGSMNEATRFATDLFKVSFRLILKDEKCILYEKIIFTIAGDEFLIAPIIVTEDCYDLLAGVASMRGDSILIPWYRPRARERLPIVPICYTNLVWSKFDMQQQYLSEIGLWRLMMPALVFQENLVGIGTFVECALSGDCFYGDCERLNNCKQKLFLDVIRHLRLNETVDVPSRVYEMMTIEKKAGARFRERKIKQFSQWI